MRKYIIPTRERINNWKNLFIEVFQQDEFQTPLMLELVSIASSISTNQKDFGYTGGSHRIRIEVFEFVSGLIDTGTLEEKHYDQARELARDLVLYMARYLNEADVLNDRSVMKYSGLTGTDIVVNILAEGEVDETEERICLSG